MLFKIVIALTLAIQVVGFGGSGACVPAKPSYVVPRPDPLLVQPGPEGYAVVQVTPNVHAIMVGGYNSLLVQGENHALLIDAGHDGAAAIVMGVKSILGEKPLTHFLYGHMHHDHVGGAINVREAYPEAVFLASASSADLIKAQNGASRPFDTDAGDVVLDITTPLQAGGRTYEFFPLSSHSQDNMAIRVDGKTIFAADLINPGSVPFFNFVFTKGSDVQAFKNDLIMLKDLEWDTFVPGHNNRMGTRDDIQNTIDYTDAVVTAAGMGFQTVSFGEVVGGAGIDPSNSYGNYKAYFDAVTDTCAQDVIAQWKSGDKSFKLDTVRMVDVNVRSHCWSAVWYHHMYAPGR